MSAEKTPNMFKLADAATALRVLASQQLRWSAPERFADPLELSSESPLGFERTSLLESTVKLASSMIFAPERPNGDSPLINAINRWRDEGRFGTPSEAYPVLRELLTKMVDYRLGQLNSNLSKWQAHARNVRVCCFCEQAESLSAWDQFADRHRGVALRFDTSDARWGKVQPIHYQVERPQITTLREQLGAILHNRPDTMVDRFTENYLIKSAHRRAEGEWRAFAATENEVPITDKDPSAWFDDFSFPKESLTGVFFGAHINAEDRAQLIHLAQQHFPQAKLMQGHLAKTNFALQFAKITLSK